jgi:hypothetical protein
LYAAYAYASADVSEQVKSVDQFMHGEYQMRLFDVAMLAGSLPNAPLSPTTPGIAPFCPMLSQGWSLLRVKNVHLDPHLYSLQDHLKPSLWTTFDPAGVDLVESSINRPSATRAT